MRVSAEAQAVRVAQSQIVIALYEMQEKHDLTDVEMFQAVNQWRRERGWGHAALRAQPGEPRPASGRGI